MLLTVGSGGDHATLSAALAALASRRPADIVEVRLLAGYIMAEQVELEAVDLAWATVTAEDATITIHRDALTARKDRWYSAWRVARGSTSPRIDVMFAMDDSGAAEGRVGFYIRDGSKALFGDHSGCTNSGERNVDCVGNSMLIASITTQNAAPDFSGAGTIGVRISNASMAHLDGVTITDCGTFNLSVADACQVNATDATLTGGHDVGLGVSGPSWVSIEGGDVSRAGSCGIQAREGHVTVANGRADDCGGAAIRAENGAVVNAGFDDGSAKRFTAQRCGAGIVARNGATVNAQGADLRDVRGRAVDAIYASRVAFNNGLTEGVVSADHGSIVDAAFAAGCEMRSRHGSVITT